MKIDWNRIIQSLAIVNTIAFLASVFSGMWQIFAAVVGIQIAGFLFGMGFAVAIFSNKPDKEKD